MTDDNDNRNDKKRKRKRKENRKKKEVRKIVSSEKGSPDSGEGPRYRKEQKILPLQ